MNGHDHGTSKDRTSSYIRLPRLHPLSKPIRDRVAALVGVPGSWVEPLQLVHYREGEFFNDHHDAGTVYNYAGRSGARDKPSADGEAVEMEIEMVQPRRLATVLVCLNEGFGGGATEFPLVEPPLSVKPVAGQALLWSNITHDGKADPLTIHRGQTVTNAELSTAWQREGEGGEGADARTSAQEVKVKVAINCWVCDRAVAQQEVQYWDPHQTAAAGGVGQEQAQKQRATDVPLRKPANTSKSHGKAAIAVAGVAPKMPFVVERCTVGADAAGKQGNGRDGYRVVFSVPPSLALTDLELDVDEHKLGLRLRPPIAADAEARSWLGLATNAAIVRFEHAVEHTAAAAKFSRKRSQLSVTVPLASPPPA
jgi:hypothetical protein